MPQQTDNAPPFAHTGANSNTVGVFFAVTVIVFMLVLSTGIYKVEEGHVGVYWRGGRLLDDISYPGYNFKVPLLDTAAQVQVTMQTDSVTNIPCGTSGGVVIHFDRIEVVNRLRKDHVLNTVREYGIDYDKMWIFDKVHHEINQHCSKNSLRDVFIEQFETLDESLAKVLQADCDRYDTGIDIITVRVTKPRIPESVRRNYEMIEAEKANLLLASERQKVVEKEAQTEANRAKIHAEKTKAVRKIELEKEAMEKESEKRMQELADEIFVHKRRSEADAESYRAEKETTANKLKLTPEYLRFHMYSALANNTKIYFGDQIPNMFLDPSMARGGVGVDEGKTKN